MDLTPFAPWALLLQLNVIEMVSRSTPVGYGVYVLLIGLSLMSWSIIFAKWSAFRRARNSNVKFLRAFRKSSGLDAIVAASEQFRPAPLVAVFDFGYEEIHRQVKSRGTLRNKLSLERSLQLGVSEELAKLGRQIDEARVLLEDAGGELRRYADGIEANPERLAEQHSRECM
jgi:biopolymer transport protein TolQ